MTGDEYFDSEEFKQLLTEYEEAVRSGQPIFMDADDLTDIADYYQFTGEREQAMEAVNQALTLSPGATLPLVFKAREALTREELEEAQDLADQIINKDDPEYHYIQAELLIVQNKLEEAEQYLSDYFSQLPPDEWQDFVMDAANLYFDYGLSDMAYGWMMRTRGDDSSDFKELMARILCGLGKFKDSERIFNELLDRNPYSKRYWNALANAQFMDEDYSNAITSSEYAIAIDPNDAEGIASKANSLFHLGNYEEALQYYERYSNLKPDEDFGELHQGICLVNMGRPQEALDHMEKALRLTTPDSPYIVQLYEELAFTYSTLHQPQKALACLDKTDMLGCDHTDMLVLRGHILLENGRLREAETAFRDAIVQSHYDPKILLRIMVSLYDNNYLHLSYTMFKKFLAAFADEMNDGFSYMALCCWDLGIEDEFLDNLKIAVERNPAEARQVLRHLYPEGMEPKDYLQYTYEQLKK